jgi:U6 snRNA-associated Sm-like protein LSm7
MDKPKREAILDLSKYVNERIRVKFTGGREGMSMPQSKVSYTLSTYCCLVTGILKGYDQLLNLVLDEVQEELVGELPSWPYNEP